MNKYNYYVCLDCQEGIKVVKPTNNANFCLCGSCWKKRGYEVKNV